MSFVSELAAPSAERLPRRLPPRPAHLTTLDRPPVLVIDVAGSLVSAVTDTRIWADATPTRIGALGEVLLSRQLARQLAELNTEIWWLTESPTCVETYIAAAELHLPRTRMIHAKVPKARALRDALASDPRPHVWADPHARSVTFEVPHLIVRSSPRLGLTRRSLQRIRVFLAEGYAT